MCAPAKLSRNGLHIIPAQNAHCGVVQLKGETFNSPAKFPQIQVRFLRECFLNRKMQPVTLSNVKGLYPNQAQNTISRRCFAPALSEVEGSLSMTVQGC